MRVLSTALLFALGACADTPPPEFTPGAKTDDTEGAGVLRRFEALAAEIEGEYAGRDVADNAVEIDVKNISGTPVQGQFVAHLTTATLYDQEVPLTYDAKNNAFVGFVADACDDPECFAIDFVSVRVHRTRARTIVVDYELKAFQNAIEDGDDSEPEHEVYERGMGIGRAGAIAEDHDVKFGEDSPFTTEVKAHVSNSLESECGGAAYRLVDEKTEVLDEELYFQAEVHAAGTEPGFIQVVDPGDGSIELVELGCPQ